jgi:isochorismate synthase
VSERVPGGRVRLTPLAPAFDLLAACAGGGPHPFRFLFEREGLGVAAAPTPGGVGVSAEPITESTVARLGRECLTMLRGLDAAAEVAPTAVGQIPFGPDGTAWLRAPTRLVRRREPGTGWLQEVLPANGDEPPPFEPVRPTGGAPSEPFTPGQVTAEPDPATYARWVGLVVERIRAGGLDKAVLARTVRVDAGRTLDPVKLAHRLRAVDPHAYAFITPIAGGGEWGTAAPRPLFVGASPELLVSRRGRAVRSTPLAGSAPRSGDRDLDRANADALFSSSKNRQEHEIVVEAIAESLAPRCDALDWDREPVLLETANVWHLATRFEGTLREPAPNVVDLVAALHPTPAVCGTPETVARATIAELEGFDRGGYAGPVGWMDAEGDGEWAIALRCARLDDDRATLFAGAGIVGDSDPAGEVDETDRKFRAFLDSLRWG